MEKKKKIEQLEKALCFMCRLHADNLREFVGKHKDKMMKKGRSTKKGIDEIMRFSRIEGFRCRQELRELSEIEIDSKIDFRSIISNIKDGKQR